VVKTYVRAAKPWLVAANALSAAGGFSLASRGQFDWGLFLASLAGISLVVASGCAFNSVIDRDIDRIMARTRNRPLASGELSAKNGYLFAALLGLCGALLLFIAVNGLALAITLAGLFVYVCAYTLWLKRTSPLSAAVGSLAGAAPPVAAYCAASGAIDPGAILLLAVFSLWQIPHSYAIALYREADYAAAGIPVFPLRYGLAAARRHIVWHIAAFDLAAMSIAVFGYAGRAYLATAAVAGVVWMLAACLGCDANDPVKWGRRLHFISVAAIAALSLMMCLDYAAALR